MDIYFEEIEKKNFQLDCIDYNSSEVFCGNLAWRRSWKMKLHCLEGQYVGSIIQYNNFMLIYSFYLVYLSQLDPIFRMNKSIKQHQVVLDEKKFSDTAFFQNATLWK